MPEHSSTTAAAVTQVPVGLLTCQHTPYLTTMTTSVLSCSSKPNKQKLYEVHLQDTVLFPEGGGQPCDYGTINETIEVKNVQRVGTNHVHHITAPMEEGAEARLALDWVRRFDHMQQHSGQHLLSAVFEQPEFGCDTLAWGMNATRCYVELSKAPTLEQVQQVEDRLNLYIRRNYPVHITFTDQRPATLPKDYVGPNGVFRVVEIMEDLDVIAAEQDPLNHKDQDQLNGEPPKKHGLVRLDYNPCCGTHVKSLKDLQCIKILHQEKIRGANCRLFFVVGQRALNLLQETYQLTRDLGSVLSAPGGPETFVETVVKTQKQGREAFKQVKTLFKEIATYQVRDWIQELKDKNLINEGGSSTPYLIKYHREDADMDFLIVLTSLLKDHDLVKGQRIFVLSAGDKKEGGPIIITGQNEDMVKKVADEISKFVEVKGGGKGRWQGKSRSWKGLETAHAAADTLISSEGAM
ncbi:hypothetical protein BC939DRAFT_449711 [Gamsiella multidivaricata]|uniref:uncharacterized protein n=1 Tax=Gamsiella multidivaricata TaxID=101098 RepID=UPI00221FF0E3|nr:uncharacterized protein BC939DRAFT_449711 [Gamsiella multidivaricata]KAG0371377.1 hypothetical protein BGZ54_000004 [Gamsiella multidivaricata]KAI7824671.1 hypothetical protein BC939DRAFT_449711 [Gamsiella multidivaricata]